MTDSDRDIQAGDSIELPAPTVWPMVLALGITLDFAGLVTHPVVSFVGVALMLLSSLGWWKCVLPVEHVEREALRPAAEPERSVEPSPAPVARLRVAEDGHRVRLPMEVQPLSAGVKGGIVGGCAMALCATAYGLVVQHSVWYPVNLLAAIAMPRMAGADSATLLGFDAAALGLGILVHGVTSVLVGLLYATILPMLPRRHIVWGGLVAPLLWSGLLWAVLGFVNPTLNARVDWVWFIASQIVFGLATGYVVAKAEPVATMQTWPLLARAGVEATGVDAPRERQR
jgi:hypothetical protein